MSRSSNRRALLLSSLLLLAACESVPALPAVALDGPSNLAIAGSYLFIANGGGARLGVVELGGKSPRYVKAPNPLEALELPTSPLPTAVAAPAGEAQPLLLCSLSTVSRELALHSIPRLVTLGKLAFADVMPLAIALAPASEGARTLYLGVELEGGGALMSLTLPDSLESSPEELAALAPTELIAPEALFSLRPQVLALSPIDPTLLAVGGRGAGDGEGALLLVDLAGPQVERFDIGGPIRALSFDRAGTRIFALLDDEACLTTACNGLVVFDLATRVLAPELGGAPIAIPGLPRALAVAGAASVILTDGSRREVEELVVVGSSNGLLYLLDGRTLEPGLEGELATSYVWDELYSMPSALAYDSLANRLFISWLGGERVTYLSPEFPLRLGTAAGFTPLSR